MVLQPENRVLLLLAAENPVILLVILIISIYMQMEALIVVIMVVVGEAEQKLLMMVMIIKTKIVKSDHFMFLFHSISCIGETSINIRVGGKSTVKTGYYTSYN